jgi:predicted GIY-YIG superfamily endonuclease
MTYYLNMSYIIYKICCDDLPEYIYVGSTKSIIKRKSQHKIHCNNGNTRKLYTTIRENGGWNNWRMVIIEECGEISLTQLRN